MARSTTTTTTTAAGVCSVALCAMLLVCTAMAPQGVAAADKEFEKVFPETVGLNKFEMPFRYKDIFDNKLSTWFWNVMVVCGMEPMVTDMVMTTVPEVINVKGEARTWQEFLDSEYSTPEDHDLVLPTCDNAEQLQALGLNPTVSVFLIYGVESHMDKLVREFNQQDFRLQMTPAREIFVRRRIRERLYDNELGLMVSGSGITKESPTMAPRLLRYIFHDALDLNNIVLFNSTDIEFPEHLSSADLVRDLFTSRDRDGEVMINQNVPFDEAMKIGGVDGCLLEPMETMLPQDMIEQVRQESSVKFFGSDSPAANPTQNIGLEVIKDIAYEKKVSNIKEAYYMASNSDVMVLATAMGLEQFYMAPLLPVTYGRRDRWGIMDCEMQDGKYAALQTSIVNSWDPATTEHNFKVFEHLGFSDPKLVAGLMGTHSAGQVQPCNTGDSAFASSLCKAETEYLISLGKHYPKHKPNYGTDPSVPAPGSFFDTTPNILDNDYYKELLAADSDRDFSVEDANEAGIVSCGEEFFVDCTMSTCDRTWSGGKFAVRMNDTGFDNGYTKRVAFTAAELLMLDKPEYKDQVKSMSESESYFESGFVDAWNKLIAVGYWPGELSQAAADKCTIDEENEAAICGTPTCVPKIDSISTQTFDLTECILCSSDDLKECSDVPSADIIEAGPCMLIGGFGTSFGLLQCAGYENETLVCVV